LHGRLAFFRVQRRGKFRTKYEGANFESHQINISRFVNKKVHEYEIKTLKTTAIRRAVMQVSDYIFDSTCQIRSSNKTLGGEK
jgi:hypothetical protein